MSWPPQSPHLSPIELAWDELYQQVQDEHSANEMELFEWLKQCWEGLKRRYNILLQICAAMTKARGGYF